MVYYSQMAIHMPVFSALQLLNSGNLYSICKVYRFLRYLTSVRRCAGMLSLPVSRCLSWLTIRELQKMHVTCCYSYFYPFSNHMRGLKLFREWRKMWLCVKFSFNRNADSFVNCPWGFCETSLKSHFERPCSEISMSSTCGVAP